MEILENASLKRYNTFGVDVRAAKFASFASAEELKSILEIPANQNIPLFILGGGSNILFTEDFNGLVLKNEVKGVEKIDEDERFYFVKAGAGENWHEFVLTSIKNDWAGLENLSLIPGNVGAGPMQNIGAYGVEVKDRFHNLEAFNLRTHEVEIFDAERCEFGYRESVFKRQFKNQYVILNVTFRLFKKPEINTSYGSLKAELAAKGIQRPSIKEVSQAVIKIRQSKLPDPKLIGNAGSFFKNPVVDEETFNHLMSKHPGMPHYPSPGGGRKIAAGWLIEKAGWKGVTRTNFGVHSKQALVLVNHGGAKGKDIYGLSEEIMKDVKEKYGIELEREVNIL